MAAFAASVRDGLKPCAPARRARWAPAFLAGVVMGVAALAADSAGANGPAIIYRSSSASVPQGFHLEPLGPGGDAPAVWRRKPSRERITIVTAGAPAASSAGAVCVRLCDGAFFPVSAGGAGSAAAQCDSQCPDAPTQVFYLNGSDRIEDAISASGEPYSALPAALRFQRTFDATCACHRAAADYSPLNDPTLRRGDAIMTPAGIVVFGGEEGGPHRQGDFIALAGARLPRAKRQALAEMERASVSASHPTLAQWLAGPDAPRLAAGAPPSAAGDDRIRLISWRGGAD
jgi:hypothetical protein